MATANSSSPRCHFLITAGPTVEDIDPVRFISNRSTGKLGIELARAAIEEGRAVTLIHGPVADTVLMRLPKSDALTVVPVRSAAEMLAAVLEYVAKADVVIMNAAVADYTIAEPSDTKLKKKDCNLVLRLKPTVDILKTLGEIKRERETLVLIGFAVETGSGGSDEERRGAQVAEALNKMERKNLDAIVLNQPSTMGADSSDFTIFVRGGQAIELPNLTKKELALSLLAVTTQCLLSDQGWIVAEGSDRG